MEEFCKKRGIKERIPTDYSGDDPMIEKLISENPEAAIKHSDEIESLKSIVRDVIIEGIERQAAMAAINEAMAEVTKDGSLSKEELRALKKGYRDYIHVMDDVFRELLFKHQAVFYQIRFLLKGEPVDPIIKEKIAEISSIVPDVLDGDLKLSDIQGFVMPEEKAAYILPEGDEITGVFEVGKTIRDYFFRHPFLFDSQCLLSMTTGTEELSSILEKAWTLVQEIDRFTLEGKTAGLDVAKAQKLFDFWVLSDMICRVGYTLTELVIEYSNKSVKEAVEMVKLMDKEISFSALERQTREALRKIFYERSNILVS